MEMSRAMREDRDRCAVYTSEASPDHRGRRVSENFHYSEDLLLAQAETSGPITSFGQYKRHKLRQLPL